VYINVSMSHFINKLVFFYVMKIIKALDKKVGKKKYYKYKINLPKKMIEDLKLENKELKIISKNNKIIIEEK